jgi:hypothetical protein
VPRKVAKTEAEKLGVFADRVSLTVMIPGRTAWGLGVLARIRGLSLGKLCETALAGVTEGQGLPWTQYEKIRASLVPKTPTPASGESLEDRAVEDGETAKTLPPALAPESAGEGGDPPRPKKPLAEVLAGITTPQSRTRSRGAA